MKEVKPGEFIKPEGKSQHLFSDISQEDLLKQERWEYNNLPQYYKQLYHNFIKRHPNNKF